MADKKPTEAEMEEALIKLNAQRRKSSVGGSCLDPKQEGVEWDPSKRVLSEEVAEKIETERRHSRGFDNFK